jgi:hypothetical protein
MLALLYTLVFCLVFQPSQKFADQSISRVELSDDSSRVFVTSHKFFGGYGTEHTCPVKDVNIKNRKSGMISINQPWKWGFMVVDEEGGTFHNEKLFLEAFEPGFSPKGGSGKAPSLDQAYRRLRQTKKRPGSLK